MSVKYEGTIATATPRLVLIKHYVLDETGANVETKQLVECLQTTQLCCKRKTVQKGIFPATV